MYDSALERNRRYAWARYYEARTETDRLSWWVAELAEWLEAFAPDLPTPAIELIGLAQAILTEHELDHIRRYVAHYARKDVECLNDGLTYTISPITKSVITEESTVNELDKISL